MRENVLISHIRAVRLKHARELINCRVAENYLVSRLLIIASKVDFFFLDSGHSKLLNDLLNRKLKEPLEREDLLRHKTILLEVAVDNFPRIVLVDGVHIRTNRSSGVNLSRHLPIK